MKSITSAITLSALLAVSGCKTTNTLQSKIGGYALVGSDEDDWQLLVGKWHGSQPMKENGRREWLTERNADGTYESTYVFKAIDGSEERSHEIGKWGISGGIYFTIFEGWIENGSFRPALPQDQWTRDAYRVISLSEEEFAYSYLKGTDTYRVVKVPKDYEL